MRFHALVLTFAAIFAPVVATTIGATALVSSAQAQDVDAYLGMNLASYAGVGTVDAPVQMVVFSDYECPFCVRHDETVTSLIAAFPADLRVTYVNFPLPFHAHAHDAAQAMESIRQQGTFAAFHALLFANHRQMEVNDLVGYAQQLGLDAEKLREDLAGDVFADLVDEHMQLGSLLGVSGTPATFINGELHVGALDYAHFSMEITDEARAVRLLHDSGMSPEDAYETRVRLNHVVAGVAPPPTGTVPTSPEPPTVMNVPIDDDRPMLGDEDALVTIVEFTDYQCPFCSRVQDTLDQLMVQYGDDLRLVTYDNPLAFHADAEQAARACFAAHEQDAFWEYRALLWENQRALTETDLVAYANQLELDVDDFVEDMASDEAVEFVADGAELAAQVEATGTPQFFVNGTRLRGAQPLSAFQELIDAQLVIANALVEDGVDRDEVYETLLEDAPTSALAERVIVEIDYDDIPTIGDDDAPVTVALFAGYQCPFSRRLAEALTEAVASFDEGTVRIAVFQFPLPMMHDQADMAAQAVTWAAGEGEFEAMHDAMMSEPLLSPEVAARVAAENGLNGGDLLSVLLAGEEAAEVQRQLAYGQSVGVTGTPVWFVNGVQYDGAHEAPAVRAAIAEALERIALDD